MILFFGLALNGAFVPSALGQSDKSEEKLVTLEGSHEDMQFLAGRSVRIKATVADDVFAAGRYVTFADATVKNIIAAGYDLEQRGGTAADMVAAAANLTVSGNIDDDLVAAARSLRISSSGTVGSDARLAGETIEMEGRIAGSMRAAARRITISGTVSGKVDLRAQRIVIAPGAMIAGDLIYRSETEAEIAEGAVIQGEIRRIETESSEISDFAWAVLGIGLLIILSWALATLLLIAAIQFLFPTFVSDAAGRLQAQPWSHLGLGIVTQLVAAALAGLLVVSIFAIPIGAALLVAIAILWLFGLVVVSACIGLYLRGRLRRPGDIRPLNRMGWALAGAIIVGIVALVPVIGMIVAGLAVAAGLGAVAAELWMRLRMA